MNRKLPGFDVLVDMARNQPHQLEELRQSLTKEVIDSASTEQQKRRLKGIQFQVEMERQRARTPLQATIRISEMMCQSMAELHKSMVTPLAEEDTKHTRAALSSVKNEALSSHSAKPAGATVLEFRSRAKPVED